MQTQINIAIQIMGLIISGFGMIVLSITIYLLLKDIKNDKD
jgi:hypothetical protein